MTVTVAPGGTATRTTLGVVGMSLLAAAAVNLLIYAVGRLAGGDFTFTQGGEPVTVDPLTVAGFSVIPLALGLFITAALIRRVPVVRRIALWTAPALALLTILIMTVPVNLDVISTLSLALCHVTLVPISVWAVRALPGAE